MITHWLRLRLRLIYIIITSDGQLHIRCSRNCTSSFIYITRIYKNIIYLYIFTILGGCKKSSKFNSCGIYKI